MKEIGWVNIFTEIRYKDNYLHKNNIAFVSLCKIEMKFLLQGICSTTFSRWIWWFWRSRASRRSLWRWPVCAWHWTANVWRSWTSRRSPWSWTWRYEWSESHERSHEACTKQRYIWYFYSKLLGIKYFRFPPDWSSSSGLCCHQVTSRI